MKKYAFVLIPALLLVGAGCASPSAAPSSPLTPPSAMQPVSPPTPAPTAPALAPTPAPAAAPAAGTAPAPSPSAQKSISITGFSFLPNSMTVSVGTTVTWTNADPMSHTVTADDGSFDSGTIASGAAFSRVFSQAGTFAYHCHIHPSMHGTIIVQ